MINQGSRSGPIEIGWWRENHHNLAPSEKGEIIASDETSKGSVMNQISPQLSRSSRYTYVSHIICNFIVFHVYVIELNI